MKNFIAQVANDVVQSPATAKVVPIAAGWLGWIIAAEWLPVIAGVLTFIAGLVVSFTITWTNWAQHKLKMKLMEKELEVKEFRIGRKDRRDD